MKKSLSLIALLVICLVMISGITLSYFTNESDKSEIHFTTGKVVVDIHDITSLDGSWNDWRPGEPNAKNITCSFVNTGSIKAYLRINLSGKWETNAIAGTSQKEPVVTLAQNATSWTFDNTGGWYYWPTAIEPGQRVPFGFKAFLDSIKGYKNANYTINVTVEAVQAVDGLAPQWD